MNAVTTATDSADRSQLTDQLARRVDGNRDGQVTSAEFSTFLAGLMQSLDEEQAAHLTSQAASSSSRVGEPSPVQLPAAGSGTLTRAQGAELLRQAFETPMEHR